MFQIFPPRARWPRVVIAFSRGPQVQLWTDGSKPRAISIWNAAFSPAAAAAAQAAAAAGGVKLGCGARNASDKPVAPSAADAAAKSQGGGRPAAEPSSRSSMPAGADQVGGAQQAGGVSPSRPHVNPTEFERAAAPGGERWEATQQQVPLREQREQQQPQSSAGAQQLQERQGNDNRRVLVQRHIQSGVDVPPAAAAHRQRHRTQYAMRVLLGRTPREQLTPEERCQHDRLIAGRALYDKVWATVPKEPEVVDEDYL